ncbi:MAG TPA: hypothetical protein VLA29_00065 [Acidimicrobiia bacterium]|nr:hypothetical protein [Acidimicrobiia bacterium]
MRDSAGTALIEVIVIGFVAMAVMVPTLLTVGALADAKGDMSVAATQAASWYARHGQELDLPDGETIVTYVLDGDAVVATASTDVTVVDVLGRTVAVTITEQARWAISPYRSSR